MQKIIVSQPEKKIPLGDLYGIFFEDLNHAADGGLYAELVQNRSFEFEPIDHPSYHALTAWEKMEDEKNVVDFEIETNAPLSMKNPHYLTMNIRKSGRKNGIRNLGFNTGIPITKGAIYQFSIYAKREQDFQETVMATLEGADGRWYGAFDFKIVNANWTRYYGEITALDTDFNGRLSLYVGGSGKVSIDFVSLFPADTFCNRKNGMRKDIASLLCEMKPKFMRFPGGCLVHDGSLNSDDRNSMYRWKNTIGPLHERPARRSNWGYNQTLGLGFFEYFQFCEDIGAKPLPVLPAGYDPHHKRIVPINELQPWIDDALDLIEFANGEVNTCWGAKRAELGHPEPFNMEYIGIGNEEVGDAFFERYPYFHKAIKSRYPDMKIIGTSGPCAAGSEYEKGWKSAKDNHTDLVDEHYYQSPEWFLANHHRYDSFKEEDPKVFLGEYASWGNEYYNALVEASYMIGLERNAKVVGLACYAPMLCNVDYVNWQPDMIWFNNHQSYGTANYYVQKLFMTNQGDFLLKCKMEGFQNDLKKEEPLTGEICLSAKETAVKYSEISLTNQDTGEEIRFDDYFKKADGGEETLTDVRWKNYSLKMNAQETEGFKGFFIEFAKKDFRNKMILEIGGWQNQDATLQENISGRNSCLTHALFEIEKNRSYQIELRVNGREVKTFIDGNEILSTVNQSAIIEPLYCSASFDDEEGTVILKVVNVQKKSVKASIDITSFEMKKPEGRIYTLAGYELNMKNSFLDPEQIKIQEHEFTTIRPSFQYEFPKESITVFCLKGYL